MGISQTRLETSIIMQGITLFTLLAMLCYGFSSGLPSGSSMPNSSSSDSSTSRASMSSSSTTSDLPETTTTEPRGLQSSDSNRSIQRFKRDKQEIYRTTTTSRRPNI